MTVSIGNLAGAGVSLDTTIGANRGRTIQVDEDTTYAEISKRFNKLELQWFRELNNLDGVDLNQSAKGKTLKLPSQSLFGEAADGSISHLTKNTERKPASDPRSLMGERPDGRSGFEAATAPAVNLTGKSASSEFGHVNRLEQQIQKFETELSDLKGRQKDVLPGSADWMLQQQSQLTQTIAELSARQADLIREKKQVLAATNPKGLRMGNAERVIADEIVSSSGPGDMALGPEGRAIVYAKVAEISEDFKAQGRDPEKMPVKDFRSLVLLELSEAAAISDGKLTPDLTAKMQYLYENNKRAFDANPHRREFLVRNYALSVEHSPELIATNVPADLRADVEAFRAKRVAAASTQTSTDQTSTASTQSHATSNSAKAKQTSAPRDESQLQAQTILGLWKQLGFPPNGALNEDKLAELIRAKQVDPEQFSRLMRVTAQMNTAGVR